MMNNKIPPPIVTLICALIIYFSSLFFPSYTFPLFNALGILILGSGLLLIFLAVKSFKKAQTTINPLQPDLASFLVTDGVFKYPRNPMYLGMLFILIFISLRFNLIGGSLVALGFVIYITKYQIVPEEIAMVKLFNDKFIAYKSRVRRWL